MNVLPPAILLWFLLLLLLFLIILKHLTKHIHSFTHLFIHPLSVFDYVNKYLLIIYYVFGAFFHKYGTMKVLESFFGKSQSFST